MQPVEYNISSYKKEMILSQLAIATKADTPVCIDGVDERLLVFVDTTPANKVKMSSHSIAGHAGFIGLSFEEVAIEPFLITRPILPEIETPFDPSLVNNRHNRRAAERKNKKKK